MVGLDVERLDTAESVLGPELIETFRHSFGGALLQSGDSGYDEARKVWNGMFDKRPGLIAECAGAADIISAVNLARDNRLLLAVRGGDHS
ncbi:MAG: FAD-linked oxidase, partial [Chloroflexi bacterium]|nr:FAD-linked oxidase [Chloroflexota bacterium]